MRTTTGASQDVRRVVPPAEAGFHDGDVDLRRGELRERRRRQNLELRRSERLGVGPNTRERGLEVGLLPADADSLGPGADVRRGVGADVDALVQEQRLREAHRRRLPVRSDDVDRLEAALGVAERRSSSPIRPRPNSSGHGLSDSSQASCCQPPSASSSRR